VFNPPSGVGAYALSIGLVFGFLSFAGFEAAASLGEETRNPRRDIPRAILGTAIFGGILYIIVTAIEVMRFGTDKAGIDAFAGSGALFRTLSSMYLARWINDIITLGIVFSAGVGPSSLWNTSIGLIVPAVGILGALLLPGLAANFGSHLSEEEGLGSPIPAGD
jgi:amino acid transporter